MKRQWIMNLFFAMIYSIGFLLFIIAQVIIVSAFPTLLNFSVSFFLTKRIKNLTKRALLFFAVSLLIYFNIRLPFIVYDQIVSIWKNKTVINKKIEVGPLDSIFLSKDFQDLKLKKFYLNTYEIGGDEGCMCYFNLNPPMYTYDIENYLLKEGAKIKKTDSAYEINCKADIGQYTTTLDIKIYDGKQVAASLKKYFRTGFPYEYGELDYSDREKKQKISFRKILLSIFNSNFLWDFIFKKNYDRKYINPLEEFFKESIYVAPSYLPNNAIRVVAPDEILKEEKSIKFYKEDFVKYIDSNYPSNFDGHKITATDIPSISAVNYSEESGNGVLYEDLIHNLIIKYTDNEFVKAIRFRLTEEKVENIYFFGNSYYILTNSSDHGDSKCYTIYQLSKNFNLTNKIIIPQKNIGNKFFKFRATMTKPDEIKAMFFEIDSVHGNKKDHILLKNIYSITLNKIQD